MNEEKKLLVLQRINKAKETLSEIDIHIENELWNTAVNRCITHAFMQFTRCLFPVITY